MTKIEQPRDNDGKFSMGDVATFKNEKDGTEAHVTSYNGKFHVNLIDTENGGPALPSSVHSDKEEAVAHAKELADVRFADDQPRDPDGKFASGAAEIPNVFPLPKHDLTELHDAVHSAFPDAKGYGLNKASDKVVALGTLKSTQDTLTATNLRVVEKGVANGEITNDLGLSTDDPAFVIQFKGEQYILDGNHRLAALKGEHFPSATVAHLNLDDVQVRAMDLTTEFVPVSTKVHKYGTTQVDIPDESEAGRALKRLRSTILEDDLAGKGTDVGGSHVTVRYGLEDDTHIGITRFLSEHGPFDLTLRATAMFPPSDSSDGAAVIIAPVESEYLHKLNAGLAECGQFTAASFDYTPHATVAYVKPDRAWRYVGLGAAEGTKHTVDSITINKRDGTSSFVKLNGQPVSQESWKPLGDGFGNIAGQAFPEQCSFGPQGEPLIEPKAVMPALRYDEDQPRDPDGKFASGGGGSFEKENPPDIREYVGKSNAPNGEPGHFSAKEGGTVFHGTGKPTGKLKAGETYTAVDYNETFAFARGEVPGAGGGPRPSTMMFDAKPGKTLDVSAAFNDMIENGDPLEDEPKIYVAAREAGARYMTFDHPSSVEGNDTFKVIVSLYPNEDLKSLGGWRLDARSFSFRYSPDQPRDKDGKFGSGGGSAAAPDANGQWDPKTTTTEAFDKYYGAQYPELKEGEKCDGRTVSEDVDNMSSISASIPNYLILEGVREVDFNKFDMPPDVTPRTKDLAEQIKASGEIMPLIVGVDNKGPYIMEGSHRYDALKILGAQKIPAIVVLDLDELRQSKRSVEPGPQGERLLTFKEIWDAASTQHVPEVPRDDVQRRNDVGFLVVTQDMALLREEWRTFNREFNPDQPRDADGKFLSGAPTGWKSADESETLYHGTTSDRAASIKEGGLKIGKGVSTVTSDKAYAEKAAKLVAEEEGGKPVVLEIKASGNKFFDDGDLGDAKSVLRVSYLNKLPAEHIGAVHVVSDKRSLGPTEYRFLDGTVEYY